jgi:hypothetical protein
MPTSLTSPPASKSASKRPSKSASVAASDAMSLPRSKPTVVSPPTTTKTQAKAKAAPVDKTAAGRASGKLSIEPAHPPAASDCEVKSPARQAASLIPTAQRATGVASKAKTTAQATENLRARKVNVTGTKRESGVGSAHRAAAIESEAARTARRNTAEKIVAGSFTCEPTVGATVTQSENAASIVEIKARRARVPGDLAQQYGEKVKRARTVAASAADTTVTRQARRDAAARERLRQLMNPGDDVLRRLMRAGAIGSPISGADARDEDEDGGVGRGARTKAIRRARQWESRCGKCGVTGTFTAAAGVCPRCGAIAVRRE